MSLTLSFLICLSVFHLCFGTQSEKRFFKERPWSKKPSQREDVKKAVKYAVENLNKIAKGKELFKLVSVTSAKTQESSKIKYEIDAVVIRNKCPTWKNPDIKSCILDKTKLLCNFIMIFNPRNSKHTLKSAKCLKLKQKG